MQTFGPDRRARSAFSPRGPGAARRIVYPTDYDKKLGHGATEGDSGARAPRRNPAASSARRRSPPRRRARQPRPHASATPTGDSDRSGGRNTNAAQSDGGRVDEEKQGCRNAAPSVSRSTPRTNPTSRRST